MPSEPDDYDFALSVLRQEDESQFAKLAQRMPGFPAGVDDFIGRRWIINAIDCGSLASIKWIVERGVDLSFRDEEGHTVLHAAIDSRTTDQQECLRVLLEAGAPVNAHGTNDWTPSHMAAVRDNVEALKLLRAHGADFSIRTTIDNYATPLEEARLFGRAAAIAYLESEA